MSAHRRNTKKPTRADVEAKARQMGFPSTADKIKKAREEQAASRARGAALAGTPIVERSPFAPLEDAMRQDRARGESLVAGAGIESARAARSSEAKILKSGTLAELHAMIDGLQRTNAAARRPLVPMADARLYFVTTDRRLVPIVALAVGDEQATVLGERGPFVVFSGDDAITIEKVPT